MQQQLWGASEFVGLDTSQPFAALKQQVNMKTDSSRVLATAVVSVRLISGSYINFCTFLYKKCDLGYYVINDDDDWWLPTSVYSFNFTITQNS